MIKYLWNFTDFKRGTFIKHDDDISTADFYSKTSHENHFKKIEYKVDRLEDLVWKLYDELDTKIQELFEEQSHRFKQQNEIVSNIFHGFNEEILTIKDTLCQFQTHSNQDNKVEIRTYTSESDNMDDGQRMITEQVNMDRYYKTTNNEVHYIETLEAVMEEGSKGITLSSLTIYFRMSDWKQRRGKWYKTKIKLFWYCV